MSFLLDFDTVSDSSSIYLLSDDEDPEEPEVEEIFSRKNVIDIDSDEDVVELYTVLQSDDEVETMDFVDEMEDEKEQHQEPMEESQQQHKSTQPETNAHPELQPQPQHVEAIESPEILNPVASTSKAAAVDVYCPVDFPRVAEVFSASASASFIIKLSPEVEEDLKIKCERVMPEPIPGKNSIDDLKEMCESTGIKCNFDLLKTMEGMPSPVKPSPLKRSQKGWRDTQTRDEDNERPPQGQFEVKKIVDWDVSVDNKFMYCVKWQQDSEDSWLAENDLQNCNEMVATFQKEVRDYANCRVEKAHEKLVLFNETIDKLKTKAYNDVCVYMKMYNCRLSSFKDTVKQRQELADYVDSYSNLLTNRLIKVKSSLKFTEREVLGITMKRFRINENFGSLEKFVHFVEQRKLVRAQIIQYQKQLNAEVRSQKDGPELGVENLVDLELPTQFTYTSKFINVDVETSNTFPKTVSHHLCLCEDDCGDAGSKCCFLRAGYDRPYWSKSGCLKTGFREPIVECTKKCSCGNECPYRVVQKGRKVSLTLFRTDNGKGWGVKAAQAIRKGSFVMIYSGELMSFDEAGRRSDNYYTMDLGFDEQLQQRTTHSVDANKKGNLSRFINHSCDPNLGICGVYNLWDKTKEVVIQTPAFFTTKRISKNEEITFDYMMKQPDDFENQETEAQPNSDDEEDQEDDLETMDHLSNGSDSGFEDESPTQGIPCKCGAENCRGTLVLT